MTAYKLWHEHLPHFPKTSRYSLGLRIDTLFIEILESLSIATYSPRDQKLIYIKKGILKLDVLKFFLQLSWQIKSLDDKKYIVVSEKLFAIGKMLGGWKGQLEKQNSPSKLGEK